MLQVGPPVIGPISDVMVVTLRQTLFLSNNLQDLTKIHIQCSHGPIVNTVNFTENAISPQVISGFH